MLDSASSAMRLHSASEVCARRESFCTKRPYTCATTMMGGTVQKESSVSFQLSENMKMSAPTADMSERRNTLTLRLTWSPTLVVSVERRLVSSPVEVPS